MINIFQPSLGEEELEAIRAVFASNWIGKGDQVLNFERKFAESLGVGAEYFVSTNSCTEAIFLASHLFDFKPGNEIIIPSVSFIAVGNSVVASGATPVFCDVDPRTLNATVEFIEQKITPRTKAVFLNHYGGVPCDMDLILELCRKHNIFVIEDAACAVHSFYKGKAVGTMGDMGMWSFDAMKVVCIGDGGMAYIKDLNRISHAKEHLYHGLSDKQKSGIDSSKAGAAAWWEFEVNRPGRKGIINNIAGAIGLVQLEKLPKFLERRKQIHEFYDSQLSGFNWLVLPPKLSPDSTTSYYFYWVQTKHRNELAQFLKEKGIYTTFRYWPLHLVNHFSKWTDKLPNSKFASENTLNIPIHQSLSDDDLKKIVDSIKEFGRAKGL